MDRKTQEVEIYSPSGGRTRSFARDIVRNSALAGRNGTTAVGGAGAAGSSPLTAQV